MTPAQVVPESYQGFATVPQRLTHIIVLMLFAMLCTIAAVAVCALYAYAMSQVVPLVVHCCKAKKAGLCLGNLVTPP